MYIIFSRSAICCSRIFSRALCKASTVASVSYLILIWAILHFNVPAVYHLCEAARLRDAGITNRVDIPRAPQSCWRRASEKTHSDRNIIIPWRFFISAMGRCYRAPSCILAPACHFVYRFLFLFFCFFFSSVDLTLVDYAGEKSRDQVGASVNSSFYFCF